MAHLAIPNLGNYSIGLASAVESLGLEPWATTCTTPEAMRLGLEVSPDSTCLPFKAHIGHFIEAARAGVEYALMVNSVGTCRLRYYRNLQQEILREHGIGIRVFGLGYDGIKPPLIRYFDPPAGLFLKHVAVAALKIRAIDAIELAAWRTRALELAPGETTRVMSACLRDLDRSRSWRATRELMKGIEARFAVIDRDEGRVPLRIGLIGEVSVLRDRTLNHNIEEILGGLGVQVRNYFLLGAELGNIFGVSFASPNTRRALSKLALPYLKHTVGGHAMDSVAHTVRCAREGYDGMVHVCPSGCMPEISIRPILRRVSQDLDIPVLQCSFDEHTSAVGLATRLEAFVDILEDRRPKRGRAPLRRKEGR